MPQGWVVGDLVRAPNLDPAIGEVSINSSVIDTPQFRVDLAHALQQAGIHFTEHTISGCVWLCRFYRGDFNRPQAT